MSNIRKLQTCVWVGADLPKNELEADDKFMKTDVFPDS